MTDSPGPRNLRPRRLVRVLLAAAVGVGVWLVGYSPDVGTPQVLPDTSEQFSLDLKVVATTDAPVVYVVEQRARPWYRSFAFDPAAGTEDSVFTVPDDAIIYGIDLDPTGSILAVTYSPDFALDGSGLWLLDLISGELDEVRGVSSGQYLTDPEWTDGGDAVLATLVDRTGDEEALDIVSISVAGGAQTKLITGAVDPAIAGTTVYYLDVDEPTSARRSVGAFDMATGADGVVVSGGLDLDHLVIGQAPSTLTVAGLESEDPTAKLTLGGAAAAHGNHDVPSTWWSVADATPLGISPATVYDADLRDGRLIYVTREGLSIATDSKLDLIESRALRFVAG